LPPLICPILAAAGSAFTRCVAALSALLRPAVRTFTALNALARTIGLAFCAICARSFPLRTGLGPLHSWLRPFRTAASFPATSVPGIGTRCRSLRGRALLASAAFRSFLWPLCEANGGSAE
jgi:hypothetical protein